MVIKPCERFYEEIAGYEKRYQGSWEPVMFVDYCWIIQKGTAATDYQRKTIFF